MSDATAPPTPPVPEKVTIFASLRLPNYRLFWSAGFVSNIGTWMARVAQDWLVLTELAPKSPIPPSLALGLVTALQFLPVILAVPWAGAVADRFPKRRVLQVTQSLMMASGLTLAGLVLGGVAALWHVFALAFVTGVASAFDAPARQSMAPEMVPRHLIPNAVGLNTTSFNIARLIGPAVAGLIITRWGVGPALLANGLSFIPVIVAMALLDASKLTPAPRTTKKGAVREGFAYVRRRSDIVVVMVIGFMLGTFGMNFQITNALAANQTFHVDAAQYGYLNSIMAVGSVTAGLLAARRTHPRLRIILLAFAGFAVTTALLAIAPNYWFYAIVLAPTGLFALTVMTSCNASIQMASAPRMRGRVTALYTAVFQGGTPLGASFVGWIGDVLGPRATLAVASIAAAVTVVGVVLYVLRRNGFQWPHAHAKDDGVRLHDIEDPR